jgi:hypothetical protein
LARYVLEVRVIGSFAFIQNPLPQRAGAIRKKDGLIGKGWRIRVTLFSHAGSKAAKSIEHELQWLVGSLASDRLSTNKLTI